MKNCESVAGISGVGSDELISVLHLFFETSLTQWIVALTAGFAFLPVLWCVNAVWFYREAFWKSPYGEQREIRRYVISSAIGGLLSISALIGWIFVFQTNRASWGEAADRISFIIPTGVP